MKSSLLPLCLALLTSSPSFGAVLFSLAGPVNVSGGGGGLPLVDTGNDAGDWITAGGYDTGTSGVPLYIRTTIQVNNNNGEAGSGGLFTALQLYKDGERLAMGNNWGSVNWGGWLPNNGSPANFDLTGAPAYVVGTPVTLVIKLDQALNAATIYFNPNLSLTEAAQPAGSVTMLSGLGTDDEFRSLNVRAGNDTAAVAYSGIEVRDDSPFAAVPEPGTTLLAGLGALGLLMRKRR